MNNDDIPENILMEATEIAKTVCRNLDYDDVSVEIRDIAQGLMRERDRCLEIVSTKCEGDLDFAKWLISREV